MIKQTQSNKAGAKPRESYGYTLEAASYGQKTEKRLEMTVPNNQWARYIDSRLKQFGTR